MFTAVKKFLTNVHGTQQGILIPEELYRAILTSLGSGTVVGVLVLLLQAVLNHVASIFPDPAIASLATISLTLILELLRRQSHGVTTVNSDGSPLAPPVSLVQLSPPTPPTSVVLTS